MSRLERDAEKRAGAIPAEPTNVGKDKKHVVLRWRAICRIYLRDIRCNIRHLFKSLKYESRDKQRTTNLCLVYR